MPPPGVEARFKKIEDNLLVTAELQRRAEERHDREIQDLRTLMSRWINGMGERHDEFERTQAELKSNLNGLILTVQELSRTVDRFLRSRTNGNPD